MGGFDPDFGPYGYYHDVESEAAWEEWARTFAADTSEFDEWVQRRYPDLVREVKRHGDNTGDFLQVTLQRLVENKTARNKAKIPAIRSYTYWWIAREHGEDPRRFDDALFRWVLKSVAYTAKDARRTRNVERELFVTKAPYKAENRANPKKWTPANAGTWPIDPTLSADLARAFKLVSERDCQVFVAHYGYDVSLYSLVETFGNKKDALKQALKRTKQTLRAFLEPLGYTVDIPRRDVPMRFMKPLSFVDPNEVRKPWPVRKDFNPVELKDMTERLAQRKREEPVRRNYRIADQFFTVYGTLRKNK
jgi:DNA-directed RNA polymerase specialized sigma24 family protein